MHQCSSLIQSCVSVPHQCSSYNRASLFHTQPVHQCSSLIQSWVIVPHADSASVSLIQSCVIILHRSQCISVPLSCSRASVFPISVPHTIVRHCFPPQPVHQCSSLMQSCVSVPHQCFSYSRASIFHTQPVHQCSSLMQSCVNVPHQCSSYNRASLFPTAASASVFLPHAVVCQCSPSAFLMQSCVIVPHATSASVFLIQSCIWSPQYARAW